MESRLYEPAPLASGDTTAAYAVTTARHSTAAQRLADAMEYESERAYRRGAILAATVSAAALRAEILGRAGLL